MKVQKIISRILRLVMGMLFNIIFIFTNMVPRCSNRWVFGAWNGKKFLDNPKHIFLYVINHHPEIKCTWITRDAKLAKDMKLRGLPVENAASIKGIWVQLRAGVAIFTHSVAWEFWAPLMAKRVFRVQTWHGMPIKHIGYDDEKDPFVKIARLLSLMFPYLDDHLNLVTAGGEADEACYRTAFNVDRHAIIKVGYARNDALLASIQKASETKEKVINVIYMPTFRGVIGSEFELFSSSGFDFNYYDALCDRLGINFWIKLHPVQLFQRRDLEAIEGCKNIHALQEVEDIYEEMGKFDILVTDFSGIYFDYLITGRPIIMAPINMGDYLNNDRTLYYRYEDICPDEPCLSWDEVFNQIELLGKNIYIPNARYKNMQSRFHANLDDHSASRTVLAIKQRK